MDIPLTGSAASIGQFLSWGANAAVDEANAAGGVNGRPVELLVLDDETDPQRALENVQLFVEEDKVSAVLGPANSGNALAIIPYLQERRAPLMLLTASATPLTKLFEGQEKNYVFRATLPDEEQLKRLAAWAVAKHKRIAVASDATPYGRLAREDFVRALAAHGVAPAAFVEFELGDLDMTEQARSLLSSGAEGVAVLSLAPEIANFVRSADAVDLRAGFFGLYPFFLPAIAQLPTRLSDGLVGVLSGSPEDSPKAAELDRIVRDKHQLRGYYPFKFVSVGYEGAKLLIQAMREAKSLDGVGVRDALESMERFEGVSKAFSKPFSPTNHELYKADDLYLGVWRNGKVLKLDENPRP
jgi:branched-chain amino acid transport system substrate-binding protein